MHWLPPRSQRGSRERQAEEKGKTRRRKSAGETVSDKTSVNIHGNLAGSCEVKEGKVVLGPIQDGTGESDSGENVVMIVCVRNSINGAQSSKDEDREFIVNCNGHFSVGGMAGIMGVTGTGTGSPATVVKKSVIVCFCCKNAAQRISEIL